MELNETPVRTSRNFKINNITLEDLKIPEVIKEFNNIEIIKESEKIEISSDSNNIALTYGLNKELEKLVNEKSNCNLNLIANSENINNQNNREINYINFKFDDENENLLENIRIVAKENSKTKFVIKYESENEKLDTLTEYFHNGIIKVIAEKNSELDIIIVNLLNQKSNNFIVIENELDRKTKINYTIIDFGGKNSITNLYSNLIGEDSNNKINTIYLGKEDQLFDLNYIGELRGEKSNINIEVQGALKDKAKKHFKGTIDFKKGCKKAIGNENENCMLLSDEAKSLALPMLLCSEEDVEGNHSSSSGKVGEKELFYIMSRGFELKEAQKLLVRAKFNKILENIKVEKLKEEILEEIDKRLD